MSEPNAFQVHDWNGQSGERWVSNQVRLDAMLAAFGDAALAAAAPGEGEQVLDIGCGAGVTSLALASHVGPGGHVLGIDISEPLIGRARDIAQGNAGVTFRLADAATAQLQPGGFDLLYSRFGVMFFDDPIPAFRHLRQALKPGGRLAFVCWRGTGENDWVRLPMGAIGDMLPPAAPVDPQAPGPFAFGDRTRVAHILTSAGFTSVDITPFDQSIPFGAGDTRDAALDDAIDMAFEVGPLSRALANQPDDLRNRAVEAVRAAFAARPGDRAIMIDGAAWIVTARQPHGSEDNE